MTDSPIVSFAALDRFYAGEGPCPFCGREWDVEYDFDTGRRTGSMSCEHADDCTLLDDVLEEG